MPRPRKPKTPPGIEAVPRSKRGRDYWAFRTRYADADGNRRSYTSESLEDVRDFRDDLRNRRRRGTMRDLDAGTGSLNATFARWLEGWARGNLTLGTRQSYAYLFNRHVADRLGGEPLRDVDPAAIETLKRDLEDAGVGAASITRTLVALQSMFTRAVIDREVLVNPVMFVRKPSTARLTEPEVLSVAEVERVRAAALELEDPFTAALVSVLAYGGLRPQDALALRWADLLDGRIRVERKNVDGEIVAGQKVRGRRARRVRIPDSLRRDLLEWRIASPRPSSPTSLIFPRGARKASKWHPEQAAAEPDAPLTKRDYERWSADRWRAALSRAELDRKVVYVLRHSAISFRLLEGARPHELAVEVGNSASTLLDNYAHVIAEYEDGRRFDLEEEIGRARQSEHREQRAA
jgi:integrase